MKKLSLLALCLGGCASLPPFSPAQTTQELQGTWEAIAVECRDGNLNANGQGYNQRLADGSLNQRIRIKDQSYRYNTRTFRSGSEGRDSCELEMASHFEIPSLGTIEISQSTFAPLKVTGRGKQIKGCQAPDPKIYRQKREHRLELSGETLRLKYDSAWYARTGQKDFDFCDSGASFMVFKKVH